MKNYNEMADNVFKRSRDIIDKRAKRRNDMLKAAMVVLPCMFILLVSVAVWNNSLGRINVDIEPGENEELTIRDDDDKDDNNGNNTGGNTDDNNGDNTGGNANGSQSGTTTDDEVVDSVGYVVWKGKSVAYSLYVDLQKSKEQDVLDISIVPPVNDGYIYHGKTITELEDERDATRRMLSLLQELIKLGDELKYGEALYTTGTPSGIKWSKELYEKTVAAYGEGVLDKYIVNGTFYKDKVQVDINRLVEEEKVAFDTCVKARESACSDSVAGISKELTGKGIENVVVNESVCVLKNITLKNFSDLTFANFSDCTYYKYPDEDADKNTSGDLAIYTFTE